MKKIILLLPLLFLFISCEKPSECIESTGKIISKIIPIDMATTQDSIKRIFVERGIELVVTQGPIFNVTVQSGENLINDIEVRREGTVLHLKDNTTCNWVREYGQTIVHVTTPKLEEIYSKTNRNISSNGVLAFPILRLFAFDKDGDGLEGAGTGDFFINVNNSQTVIEANNISRFYISGTTNDAIFNIYANDGRIESQNLIAQTVKVFHRGSNDIITHPVQSIIGKMVSTGNVILKNNPPIVNVEQLYQGRVIYN